jgi:hypothetical protein
LFTDHRVVDRTGVLGDFHQAGKLTRITDLLAEGGDIIESGKILVGENGPEIFEAKAGARVTPLDRYQDESRQGKGDVYQDITINSPKPLSPSETAKQFKRASRQLALEFA